MKTLFGLACVLTLLPGPQISMAQPKLTMMEETFDLDTLMAGAVAERKVTIKNTGNEQLIIEKVEASCGCTGTLLSSDKLKPGESGEIKISFNSKNFNGQIHKVVTIISNDPKTPRKPVEFTGFVIEEVFLSETRFNFKDSIVGERKTMNITLTNNGKEPLDLKEYTTNLTGFTMKYPPSIKPGESAQLVAEFVPKEAKKVVSSNVTLQTNNKSKPEILLYVFGSVKDWKFE